ncbi:Putative phage abortive infection protein [Lutibacter agarilyticus]|uniref:Putative phage abortive infection protein n=1 Tax=Lutibacter agarilyticus TaxID=1109740 RepID=A0A238XSY8_9FLAO|nr:putative phage abortive infection protein [Lutibacter agarilyticus]SNR61119.1 Putative phage abortive infection protein [Lutibacter agarilyticus]
MLNEKNSIRLLWIGLLLFVIGFSLFIWKENLSTTEIINSAKIAQFGDFIGGVIGSIWSLAGVILFYVALTEQRTDIQINRETLNAQVKALNQQIEEFKLQKVELEQTREVFKEQSETLKIQRFENTFFQLLNLHHEIIDKFNFNRNLGFSDEKIEKREIISKAFEDLSFRFKSVNSIKSKNSIGETIYINNEPENIDIAETRIDNAYKEFYYKDYKQLWSHYFRNIYHIFKFIYFSKLIENEKKQFYASIARAQLSSDELFLILYNALQPKTGYPNFLFLIKEFDILQNFDFGLVKKYNFHYAIYNRKLKDVKPEFEVF